MLNMYRDKLLKNCEREIYTHVDRTSSAVDVTSSAVDVTYGLLD